MIGLIILGTKQTGKRSAEPHAAFDVAGAGNVTMVAGLRSIAKAMGLPPAPTVRAPALDPTCERLGVRLPGRLSRPEPAVDLQPVWMSAMNDHRSHYQAPYFAIGGPMARPPVRSNNVSQNTMRAIRGVAHQGHANTNLGDSSIHGVGRQPI